MTKQHFLYLLLFMLFLSGCNDTSTATLYQPKHTGKSDNFLDDVKPILDKRCVSCHSCYNSPCQAKYSSFEGIDRGASKELVYDATRLFADDPTRLFIDAQSTKEWREKDFYSLTQGLNPVSVANDSIMGQMLRDKMLNPEYVAEYSPETDKLICPRNQAEMQEYRKKKPKHGMPYGFPALQKKEYKTLMQWLDQGARGPNRAQQEKLTEIGKKAQKEIAKWEAFLNQPDAKHAMTARYLYEHYFLAHINFSTAPDEFYELLRSRTASPKAIDVIPTLRPFEDPGTKHFYYRFRRIHSTIVHKTHIVARFDADELSRIKAQFIAPKWLETPHRVGYDIDLSSNPFLSFAQIPVKARYQFLLDHSHYVIKTFIRGPVCRGQIALNVINDHFWVMFQDPRYDISVQAPEFLQQQAKNLRMPIRATTMAIVETFSDAYRKKYARYFDAKQAFYDKTYPQGIGLEGIWKGERAKDAPVLTVYRHFDSASVHRGVLGELPKTMWVIDYPQFERIYYSLVAGYDVYGNVSHQTNIRRYMDFLRMEGEANFLAYMPDKVRLPMFKSWYIGDKEVQREEKYGMHRETGVDFKTSYPKNEFIELVVRRHILKSTGIKFDGINYFRDNEKHPTMPKYFRTRVDLEQGVRSLTAPGTGFLKYVGDFGINLLHIRVKLPKGNYDVTTMVINRWHDNVNSLFGEESKLNSAKDTFDFIHGSIGSYPNMFGRIHYKDLPDFFDLIENFDRSEKDIKRFEKYFISRGNPKFWETFDWFQDYFNKEDPLEAGLYDLNRYYRKVW